MRCEAIFVRKLQLRELSIMRSTTAAMKYKVAFVKYLTNVTTYAVSILRCSHNREIQSHNYEM